ncbi:acyl-[ACP]--phospholipid O-acyltransferase [Verrucomicrobiota bacterium]
MKADDSIKLPRSVTWLNVTQFLGALNDNIFKLLVIYFLLFLMGDEHRSSIIAIAGIVFVLPFLLFSHAAGIIADKLSKKKIIVFCKFLEIAVMALGCLAIVWGNKYALFGVIFLMSTQSALFGPSKYGIIPELVSVDKLSKTNGALVGLTYLAIIIGAFIPSYLLLEVLSKDYLSLGLFCVMLAFAGTLASMRITETKPAGSTRKFTPFFIADIFRTLREVKRDQYMFFAIIGSAYFMYLGAFMQQNILLFGRENLFLSWEESGYIFSVAALGIGLGAVFAARISGRHIEFGIVPVGALGLTTCCLLLGAGSLSFDSVVMLILLVGISCGLFIVPLNAFIQYRCPEKRLGEILACQNFVSFLGVALAAATVLLFDGVLGLTPSQGFLILGSLTAVLFIGSLIILPDFFVRFIIIAITRLFYRIKVHGLENLPIEGSALLVSNHVTWVDALIIGSVQQRRICFVMGREIYQKMSWLRPVFRLMKVILVSPDDAPRKIIESLHDARAALDRGSLVCIFAEGALTRNGNMRGFRSGMERIVKGTMHPVIPVHIDGAWGSIFSHYYGKILSTIPKKIPYPVTVQFGRQMPPSSSAQEVREAVLELSGKAFDLKKAKDRILPQRFVKTARQNWFANAVSDTTGKSLSFGKTLVSAIVLSEKIEQIAGDQEKIGVVLPASVGGVLTNIAITLQGRVPVNLNFTASTDAIKSAITQCNIKTIISSHVFLDKLKDFKIPEETVFIEDISRRITAGNKLRALLKALFMPVSMLMSFAKPGPDSLATVIFSSGSTGEPKGVMLSHHNIISNIESFSMVFRFSKKDRICGVLPLFHSFGFTCAMWCPLIGGFSACYHPNPVDGAKIAEVVRETRSTLLMSTPTFLLAYIRRAKREDFASLKAVVVGAEKLKKRVADSFEEKFGIRPLEGYGATELSPAANLSIPDVEVDHVPQIGVKEGSIGHPVPGVAEKIIDIDSGKELPYGEEGVLFVKGPNVMMGYLHNPEKTAEVLKDGWYNTGDIAKMDEDGFVYIVDRLSRFSKIGGEMVPHLAVEEKFMQALDSIGQVVSVTSAPDEKRGEQLVVVYTDEAGSVDELRKIMKESDLPNLWKPKKDNFVRIETIPVLGSGKVDLKQLKQIAKEYVENRPGILERAVEKIREKL